MSVKALGEILDKIEYPVNVEIIDHIWYREYGNFIWNTDDNEEHLLEEDGDTYSVEANMGDEEYDGYIVVNGDNGCGDTITFFFNKSKEVKL